MACAKSSSSIYGLSMHMALMTILMHSYPLQQFLHGYMCTQLVPRPCPGCRHGYELVYSKKMSVLIQNSYILYSPCIRLVSRSVHDCLAKWSYIRYSWNVVITCFQHSCISSNLCIGALCLCVCTLH